MHLKCFSYLFDLGPNLGPPPPHPHTQLTPGIFSQNLIIYSLGQREGFSVFEVCFVLLQSRGTVMRQMSAVRPSVVRPSNPFSPKPSNKLASNLGEWHLQMYLPFLQTMAAPAGASVVVRKAQFLRDLQANQCQIWEKGSYPSCLHPEHFFAKFWNLHF